MKRTVMIIILPLIMISYNNMAQETSIFPLGHNSPTKEHNVGEIWLNELNAADSIFQYSIAVVTSEPGARLDWHKHPGGQILLITAGKGYYQERGKPKQIIQKGDVIKCLPNVEHWHGATPETSVTYIASAPSQKGRTIWLERLKEEEYFGEVKPTKIISKEDEILNISKNKWRLMSEKNVDSLNLLFNEKAKFVHMGGTMKKDVELNIIKTGGIHYKHAEIQESSVEFIGQTAIVLNKIILTAIVGGNEVVNPFMVTEVYVHEGKNWQLGSMAFTKLLTPEDMEKMRKENMEKGKKEENKKK